MEINERIEYMRDFLTALYLQWLEEGEPVR
jgi:hypothetical protein